MNVLATRALSYPDEIGNNKELILTIFMPFEAKEYQWKCGFQFGPPVGRKVVYGVGIDFAQAFLSCLVVARAELGTYDVGRQARWQGMPHCGLPEFTDDPAVLDPRDVPPPVEIEGSKDVLATRAVGFRDQSGIERELSLTIFAPSKAEGDVWTCGFTFDPPPFTSIRYGVGADFVEALLDSLAKARVTYEGIRPKGCELLDFHSDCDCLPYKVGSYFWMDRARESLSRTPDAAAG